ncbi:MAG TPA: tetratricopeptide repeat protein [Gammaproteobacteria bacterium]|nr:tetratricopeptide repeat protein [Gammaproteobacteria bacterium]
MLEPSIEQSFAQTLELHQAGRLSEAERGYRQILRRHPGHPDSLHLLGVIALQTGHLEPALQLIRRAAALRPDAALYRNNLGQVLERLGREDEARAAYEAAIELDPHDAEPLNNLGHFLMRRGRLSEAEACCRAAITLNPNYAEPHVNLGNVQKERGELDDALASYRRAIALRPELSALHSNLLLALHYHPDCSPEELAREHRQWAARHVAPLASERRPHANDRRPDRTLRIGYVSPDFRDHSVARFMLPILQQHDREQLAVFAYSDVTRPDAVTELIRGNVDTWRNICTLSDAQLAEVVRDDRIDILVDLAAHSGRNRLVTFARKPAPVQVTYLAYCSTTGVDAIDYRLTDRFLDPPDGDLSHYSERSIRLPDCYWCYAAPSVASARPVASDRRPGPPTFGCLNNFVKVTPATLGLWARLLLRVPEARLLLHAPEGSHRDRVHEMLRRAGVPKTRIAFIGTQPFEDYLNTYREIDVALDPFPFAGGTTTCDALWMGVPVVSLAGRRAVSRAGSSLLSNAGLGDLVARNEDQYLDLAAGLIRERPRLAAMRLELRSRLESSPVMDQPRFTRNLEAAFRRMWRTWCGRE